MCQYCNNCGHTCFGHQKFCLYCGSTDIIRISYDEYCTRLKIMTSEEILQRIAFLLWNDAQLTEEAEKHCKMEGVDPNAYMKQLEEYKAKDKPGVIKTDN